MKIPFLYMLLGFSTIIGAAAVFTNTPRRMVLSWLGVGLFQSAFFLLLGFELLGILSALFVVGSAIVLQLFSALFGTRDTHLAEKQQDRATWVKGLGSTLTLGAILCFALSDVQPFDKLSDELSAVQLSSVLITRFPELPWVLAIILFLVILVTATIGRPSWKKVRGNRA